jgi:prepilin peptidase CpaA
MSLLALLQTGCLIAFAGVLLVAAWRDLRTMRIANGFSLAIVGAFGLWAVVGLAAGTLSLQALAWAIACGAGLFALGAGAFAMGMIGGGDVKLMAAVGLFAGPALLLEFLTVMALAGGALGFAVLAGAPLGAAAGRGEATVRARLRGGLPYGPAIATGGLWVAALRVAG